MRLQRIHGWAKGAFQDPPVTIHLDFCPEMFVSRFPPRLDDRVRPDIPDPLEDSVLHLGCEGVSSAPHTAAEHSLRALLSAKGRTAALGGSLANETTHQSGQQRSLVQRWRHESQWAVGVLAAMISSLP